MSNRPKSLFPSLYGIQLFVVACAVRDGKPSETLGSYTLQADESGLIHSSESGKAVAVAEAHIKVYNAWCQQRDELAQLVAEAEAATAAAIAAAVPSTPTTAPSSAGAEAAPASAEAGLADLAAKLAGLSPEAKAALLSVLA